MATKTYSALDICGVQFNRLGADGAILNGATDVVVTCGLVDIATKPMLGDDRTTTEKNGSGGECARRVQDGGIIGYEVTLTLCSITDGDLMELLGIFDPVKTVGGDTVGIQPRSKTAACYCAAPGSGLVNPGVSAMFWYTAWCGEDRRNDLPFVIEAFPKIVFSPSTVEKKRSSEFNQYTLIGKTKTNPLWVRGPGSIYPATAGIGTNEWAEFLSAIPFPGGCGCGVCDQDAGFVPTTGGGKVGP
jgi:hypothetical protein